MEAWKAQIVVFCKKIKKNCASFDSPVLFEFFISMTIKNLNSTKNKLKRQKA